MDISSVDQFIPDPRSRSSFYHRFRPRSSSPSTFIFRPVQAVILSNVNKPTDRRSRPRCRSLSTFSSTSSSSSSSSSTSTSTSTFSFNQASVGADFSRTHNPRPRYSYNFSHRIDTKNNIKTMNEEFSKSEDWVSLFVPIRSQKKSVGLSIMDISMIGVAFFNFFVQKISRIKNIQIFSFSIRDIEKILISRFTIDPAKKLSAEYHEFFAVFFRADSNKLSSHRFYDHKILLMEKTFFFGNFCTTCLRTN